MREVDGGSVSRGNSGGRQVEGGGREEGGEEWSKGSQIFAARQDLVGRGGDFVPGDPVGRAQKQGVQKRKVE